MPEGQQTIYIANTKPGIQRDGTALDRNFYNDGQWVRFQRGRPKKMGGYREVGPQFTGPVRGIYVWSRKNLNIIYSFSSSAVEGLLVDENGSGGGIYARTPAGFTSNANYQWQVDSMYDDAVGSNKTMLLAHAANNGANIDDDTATSVFYGDITTTTALTAIPSLSVSGGIVAVPPYLIAYGSDGYVTWSNQNEPLNFTTGDAGSDRVTGAKVVKGLPIRSGNAGPAVLLWSLDSVIRMSWVGGQAVFRFEHLTSQSSILSSNSVIEYDGVYFWVGIDRFMMFNGVVREIPNQMNLNWFFDNINFAQRQKVWAMKIPRYGEIWWFYPRGTATECTHAVIYNVREDTWYDAELGRAAGYYSQVFHYPVMADSTTTDGLTSVWLHEIGKNKVQGDNETAIESHFTTHDFGLPTGGPDSEKAIGVDRWTRIYRVEPDFLQTGDMTCNVLGSEFANASEKVSADFTFTPDTTKIDMREQRREIRLKFTSNALNGHYEMGRVLIHLEPGDVRS